MTAEEVIKELRAYIFYNNGSDIDIVDEKGRKITKIDIGDEEKLVIYFENEENK